MKTITATTAMGTTTVLMTVVGVSLLVVRGPLPIVGPGSPRGSQGQVELTGITGIASLKQPFSTHDSKPGNSPGNGNGGPGQGNGPGNGAGQGGGAGTRNGTFAVAGGTTGLYPGASLPMTVTITNPHSFALDVREVTTTVGASDRIGCAASWLAVSTWTGHQVVERNATTTIPVVATLAPGTPDACQGATWTLTYSGTADKATS